MSKFAPASGILIALLAFATCDQMTTTLNRGQVPDSSRAITDNDLAVAIRNGDTDSLNNLLPSIRSLNSVLIDGFPPLTLSIKEGHLEVSQLLLEAGANPNLEDKFGDIALVTAIRKNNYEHVLLCLKYRANPNHMHRVRYTPAYFDAIGPDRKDILLLLSEYDLDLDLTDGMGDTAASFAALTRQYDIVIYFLRLGVDPKKQSVLGIDLAGIAEKYPVQNDAPGFEFYKEVLDFLQTN